MSITTHVATADRRAVFIKRASTSASAARLAREAEILARVAGPGVVELVEYREDGPGALLVTRFVGGGSIAERLGRGRVDPEAIASLAASLCETLAAAHDLGVVHGRLRAEHVLAPVSSDPVLCGWAEAAIIGGPLSETAFPAPTPADDVVGVASLVIEMLGDATGAPVRRLHAVAQRALAGSASARGTGVSLSMGAMAMAYRALAAGESGPPTPGAMPATVLLGRPIHARNDVRPSGLRCRFAVLSERWGDRRRRRRGFNGVAVRLAGAVVPVVGIAVGVFNVIGTSDAPSSRASGVSAVLDDCNPEPASTGAVLDVDGDGCFEPIGLRGNIASVGDVSWRVGEEGDLVVLGDWNGDGVATPGVVRSTTGEVWVYQDWAGPGEHVEATSVHTSVRGRHIGEVRSARVVDARPAGHDAIEVTDAEGVTHTVVP